MPRSCTVCQHEDAVLINEALVLHKASNRTIAKQYGLHYSAVQRHREHVPKLLVQASKAADIAEADSLLDRVEALQARTLDILEVTEETQDHKIALAAIREARANLELVGEVTKELNRTPSLNLHLSPEWLQIEATIVSTLDAFPEAREAVVSALKELPNGSA